MQILKPWVNLGLPATKAGKGELQQAWGHQFGERIDRVNWLLRDEDRISSYLGQGLLGARMPDGRRLVNVPEFIEMLLLVEGATRNERMANSGELDELNAALEQDVEAFQRKEWKHTGLTGSEMMHRINKIERERTDNRDGALPSAEELELTNLMNSDIGEFMNGNWRRMNITPSQRMLDLARARSR